MTNGRCSDLKSSILNTKIKAETVFFILFYFINAFELGAIIKNYN